MNGELASAKLKASIGIFIGNVEQIASRKQCPAWFAEFSKQLETILGVVVTTVTDLESKLAIQKAVTDGLSNDRVILNEKISLLEEELEDQRQYTRRTNLLFHGIEEEKGEDTDMKVMNIINNKLTLPTVSIQDISRTHRLGRPKAGVKRPIIVRFVSYRERKMVFDKKSKLKGSRTVITENLNRERYALYKMCVDKYGRD